MSPLFISLTGGPDIVDLQNHPNELRSEHYLLFLADQGLDHMLYLQATELSKHPIRSRYLDHVTGHQPIREQYFMIRSVPNTHQI